MILFLNFWHFSITIFNFTQWWVDGWPGNECFWISHKISDLLTPLTPLSVRPQLIISLKMKFETDWSNSSQCEPPTELLGSEKEQKDRSDKISRMFHPAWNLPTEKSVLEWYCACAIDTGHFYHTSPIQCLLCLGIV